MNHPTDRTVHTIALVKPVMEHWLEVDIYVQEGLLEPYVNGTKFKTHNPVEPVIALNHLIALAHLKEF